MFGGEDMARLPLYNPRATMRTDDERAFVDAVRDASALIIASPGYHGSISGVVKNALDLLQETARDERPYLADMPEIGRASCRERVLSERVDLGGRRIIKKKKKHNQRKKTT